MPSRLVAGDARMCSSAALSSPLDCRQAEPSSRSVKFREARVRLLCRVRSQTVRRGSRGVVLQVRRSLMHQQSHVGRAHARSPIAVVRCVAVFLERASRQFPSHGAG